MGFKFESSSCQSAMPIQAEKTIPAKAIAMASEIHETIQIGPCGKSRYDINYFLSDDLLVWKDLFLMRLNEIKSGSNSKDADIHTYQVVAVGENDAFEDCSDGTLLIKAEKDTTGEWRITHGSTRLLP